jgi:Tripartite tricarboxylate transporter family receptor
LTLEAYFGFSLITFSGRALLRPFTVRAAKKSKYEKSERTFDVPDFESVVAGLRAGRKCELPDFQMVVWYVMYAPKGTPKPIIDKLSAALQKALQDPDVQERPVQVQPERARPDVLRDHLKAEIDRWVPIIRKAGVLAQ